MSKLNSLFELYNQNKNKYFKLKNFINDKKKQNVIMIKMSGGGCSDNTDSTDGISTQTNEEVNGSCGGKSYD